MNNKLKISSFLYVTIILCLLQVMLLPARSSGASADEVLVVVNKRMSGAKNIAKYYMKKRKIPENRLLVTSLSLSETIERDEFEKKLMLPVRKKIADMKDEANIYAVVLIYGVPLKVLPPALDGETSNRTHSLADTDKRAAVDSELMLAKVIDYELSGWIENPYFIGFQGKTNTFKKDDVLLVSRLDGPDEKTVYRMMDDTLAAEKTGLQGIAYFDARWPLPKEKQLSGYAQWDASLHRAAAIVAKRMEVQLDAEPALLAMGAAPHAALYSGWYSLAKYVDSFDWVQGAVGYHIASAECSTLKQQDSQVWCMQMLKHGIAATIGPVYEPYVQGFPLPELFFAALTEGYLNLGESYLISLPYISWQMVLVGDPLYKPFAPFE